MGISFVRYALMASCSLMQGGEIWVRTLGGLEVGRGEMAISSFGSRRARTVLAILATSERPVHRDALAKILWPEDPIEAARPRLRTEIHRLKEALGPLSEIVLADRETISIDRSKAAIDLDRIDFLAQQADGESVAKLLQGPLLPHELDEWCRQKRGHWDDKILGIVESVGRAVLARGGPENSLVLARRGLSILSDRPGLIRLVMESLVALHDLPEALAVYDRYVDRLEAEADLVPDNALAQYAASLRADRSPEAAQPPVTASLPARTAKIFGREEAIGLLAKRILAPSDEVAFFTLLGPGGVGKTTVALETARRLETDLRGRAYFVPLAGVFEAARVASAVAHAVEATGSADDDFSAILARLKGMPCLLVLDNFEQLVPEGSRWVGELARRLPLARILVTSRRPLGLSIERRVPLQPLSTADGESPAVSLFIDRARRTMPEFDPGPEEKADIAKLAERLEGLPLGLVLAAARVSAFTPGQMLQDVAAPAAALSFSEDDSEERHRSLAAAIQWSLDLLPSEHRAFLGRLTVFPRSWTPEAAAEIAGDEAASLLPSLVDQSLLLVTPTPSGPRFRMLQMIREHLMRHHGNASSELRGKHAGFYSGLVAEAFKTQKEDINRNVQVLRPEMENVEAAMDWLRIYDREKYYGMLVGLTGFWCFRQNERRALDWVREAVAEVAGRSDAMAADLNLCACRLLLAGRYDEAQVHSDVALRLYEAAGDRLAVLSTLRYRSHLAYYRSDFHRVTIESEATIRLSRELGDRLSTALSLSDLALAQANLGQGEAALASLNEALAIHEERNDPPRILAMRQSYAAALLSMRRWYDAEQVLLETLERNRDLKHEAIDLQCHTHLTTVCLRTGRIAEAEQHLKFARDPARGSHYAFLEGIRNYLGVLLGAAKRDRREAERSVRQLFTCWASVSQGPSILPAIDVMAYALAVFDQPKAAKGLLDGADALREQHGLMVSPHYSVTHEDARRLLGPYEPTDPPESFLALYRTAQNAIWIL